MSKETRATIYGDSRSGNCYKLKLAAAQLGFDYEWQAIDVMSGKTREPAFLALNPNGRVPLLRLADGRCLPESNAILCYLADGTALVGADRYSRAEILAWMFFEQYGHEPYIATSRFIIQFQGSPPERQAELEAKKPGGYHALNVMEQHLAEHDFFVDEAYSIADIALFAYTHVAHEGGFDLSAYPAIGEWLERVRGTDGFVPM